MAMIKLTGINKIYRTNEIETLALENVNLDVAKGEFVSIMGPSGCGKSTLLNIMGLLDAPSSGKIEINGTSVESMKDKELAATHEMQIQFDSKGKDHLETSEEVITEWIGQINTDINK